MSKRVNEQFENAIFSANITKAHENAYYACEIGPVATGVDDHPTVRLTSTTADANTVYGEIGGSEEDGTGSIQTGGIGFLRSAVAYVAAVQGQTVVASATAGVIQAHATAGRHRILGGGTINGINVYKVRFDS